MVGSGVVFVNPESGSSEADSVTTAAERCGLSVEMVHQPDRLAGLIRGAIGRGCQLIGVAGGDGTVRTAAEVLAGGDVPLLVIPAGTRNHFARELGIECLDDVADVVAANRRVPVSLGVVNGRTFVNNASLGVYPALVRRRERLRRIRSKSVANLIAAGAVVRHEDPLVASVDGKETTAWLVFIGNGRYGKGFVDLLDRDTLESEMLDVRVLRADRRLARARAVIDLATGRLRRSSLLMCSLAAAVPITVDEGEATVALDGELFCLASPLRFEVRPRALLVMAHPRYRSGD